MITDTHRCFEVYPWRGPSLAHKSWWEENEREQGAANEEMDVDEFDLPEGIPESDQHLPLRAASAASRGTVVRTATYPRNGVIIMICHKVNMWMIRPKNWILCQDKWKRSETVAKWKSLISDPIINMHRRWLYLVTAHDLHTKIPGSLRIMCKLNRGPIESGKPRMT